jgi:hypothetical protein
MLANIAYSLFTFLTCLGIFFTYIKDYNTTGDKEKAKYRQAFDNGKNLAFNICGQCHYDQKTKHFTGLPMEDMPHFMGKIYSANLTHSTSKGIISGYTDNQLANLLKTGVANDGRYIPFMIRPNLSEEDMADIFLYFRSNDPAVMADDSIPGKTRLNALGRMANHIAVKRMDYKKDVKRPDKNDAIANGCYLVDNIGCYHCHSKKITGLDYLEPEKSKGYLQGGMKFKDKKGHKIYAANLTPDENTGIGKYNKEKFRRALKNGISATGDSLRIPMPKFKHLTQKQCDEIFAYLHALKPVQHKIKRR